MVFRYFLSSRSRTGASELDGAFLLLGWMKWRILWRARLVATNESQSREGSWWVPSGSRRCRRSRAASGEERAFR